MSTQTQLPELPSFQNQIQNHRSLLDEPWKVTLIPAAAPVDEDPHAHRSLPWRVGDVTRLKDDSPKGMMEYIATHSTGWWREMAERALRDTEKAERMAREAGWQHGQYWALEVDAEAKQKLLDAEEARRMREEAERAREEAEKQAFVQRQMELLERAGRAPRCEYEYTDGRGCKSPQVRGERWCHGHAKMMSYRPEKLEILPMEDEQAVMVNLYRVTNSLLAGRISEKVAGLTLWSIAIGAPRLKKPRTFETQRKGGSRGQKKVSREFTRTNTNEKDALRATEVLQSRQKRPLLQDDELKRADHAARGITNSGVTNDKSFVFGVEAGDTSGAELSKSGSGENSLQRRGRNQHSRDLSTSPRVANASSESLKMTRGGEHEETLQREALSSEAAESGHCRIGTSVQRDIGTAGDQKTGFIET
jgi:hypothetical protein